MMHQFLLQLHILAGVLSLIGAFGAITARLFTLPHSWHVWSGRLFVLGMAVIFITVVPLALFYKINLFLALVGVFSAYLAWTGWRYATNRSGTPHPIDWVRAGIMIIAAITTFFYGIYILNLGSKYGWVLLVFAALGLMLGVFDLRSLKRGGLKGKERIAQHLAVMLGGTIAAITAVLVTQVKIENGIVLWLAPTLVLVPMIRYWRHKTMNSQ